MIEGCWVELLFEESQVLVKSQDLINDYMVCRYFEAGNITYHHMLFERNQAITANGVPCESYSPGAQTMAGFDTGTQEEIFNYVPEIAYKSWQLRRGSAPHYKRAQGWSIVGSDGSLIIQRPHVWDLACL